MCPKYNGTVEAASQALNLGQLLRRAQWLVEDQLIHRMVTQGYTDSQPTWHHVFFTIDPGGSRLTTLAQRAEMSLPAMWEIVQDLEARGYLERRPDPEDRRAKLICLTEDGKVLVRQGRRAVRVLEGEYRRRLGDEQFEALRASLRALIDQPDTNVQE